MTIPQQGPRAARCPKCDGPLGVNDSRAAKFLGAPSIRRRRACLSDDCGHRFTTFEVSAETIDQHFEQLITALDATTKTMRESLTKLRQIINDR